MWWVSVAAELKAAAPAAVAAARLAPFSVGVEVRTAVGPGTIMIAARPEDGIVAVKLNGCAPCAASLLVCAADLPCISFGGVAYIPVSQLTEVVRPPPMPVAAAERAESVSTESVGTLVFKTADGVTESVRVRTAVT